MKALEKSLKDNHQTKGSSSRLNGKKSRPNNNTTEKEKNTTQDSTTAAATAASASAEPLDLADLDLSRLRLSKKELETLSSITPGLPKCFQEQLLAKLPPLQARKLSRTLSMQNNTQTPTVKVYKRSQSGGRGVLTEVSANSAERCDTLQEESESSPVPVLKSKSKTIEPPQQQHQQLPLNSTNQSQLPLMRRSLSRTRYELESGITKPHTVNDAAVSNATRKSRSNSVCRDDYSKSLFSTQYTSDVSDKYKYYSPYLSKSTRETSTNSTSTESGSTSPYKRYSSVSPRESTIGTVAGRPPSGCMSPPPVATATASGEVGNTSSLRRRPTQRRISRFLRPDFYDPEPTPNASEETAYQRERKLRERETQSVLREIREKSRSREPSRERVLENEATTLPLRKHSVTGMEAELLAAPKCNYRHVRNKSMELYNEPAREVLSPTGESTMGTLKQHRRSLSRPRNCSDELDTHALADKILQELQLLSAMRTKQEKQRLSVPREVSVERTTETSTIGLTAQNETVNEQKTITVKKVKKLKPKDKSSNGDDSKTTTTTVVKKVKKIVKKAAENAQIPSVEVQNALEHTLDESTNIAADVAAEEARKESKLKRPKSYPTKEIINKTDGVAKVATKPITTTTIPETICNDATCPLNAKNNSAAVEAAARESRLIRPKSYPASKLTPPKDVKKIVTRSGVTIPTISESEQTQRTSAEKSESVTPTGGKSNADTSSSSDSKPTVTVKKTIKVSKKSKLMQPTAITPTTPTQTPTTAATTPINEAKEWKEKSPEKKPGKGLLYAIGQKFEKLRDSAMNKEKKLLANSASAIAATAKTTNHENSPTEKSERKLTLLKKKKSLDSNSIAPNATATLTNTTLKTEKTAKTSPSDETKKTKKSAQQSEGGEVKPLKSEKRSRIDAMIRSLRERSVPRAQNTSSESNYIKRAVSVEEMPGTFNKIAVNKVLGLFKRFEKEGSSERRVRSTRSTSNIERQISVTPNATSPIYQNTLEARQQAVKPVNMGHGICCCEANCPGSSRTAETLTCPDCIAQNLSSLSAVLKRREESKAIKQLSTTAPTTPTAAVANNVEHIKIGNKDKRKGLMLDLVKLDNVAGLTSNGTATAKTTATATMLRNSKAAYINGNAVGIGNGLYSNLPPYPCGMVNSSSNHSSSQHSMENATNNNSCMTNNNNNNNNTNSSSMHTSQTSGYRTSSTHEINRNNPLTPSTENIANYSSDCSRSYQDDCASTSTFLSPTDEPELYFDNWSVCSEDNHMLHVSPSPTVSRLSRTSQLSSPTRGNGGDSSDPNESVIDRIKRRSFYCRFNEKKPKRTSTIVGPSAVRDYYREQKAAMKATRSGNKERTTTTKSRRDHSKSPDITQEFLRPLKLSPVGTELKPPIYKSPYREYTGATTASSLLQPRKSLNDIRTSTSTTPSYLASKHRYGTSSDHHHQHDYLTVPTAMTSHSSTRYKSSSSSTSPYDAGTATGMTTTGGGGGGASTSSNYYSTYNPKRRSSYTLNGILPSGTSGTGSTNIDSYATLGRRSTHIRPYDERTRSLLDAAAIGTSSSYRREARTPIRDYTTPTISRSNSHYRTGTSVSRSPTNI